MTVQVKVESLNFNGHVFNHDDSLFYYLFMLSADVAARYVGRVKRRIFLI